MLAINLYFLSDLQTIRDNFVEELKKASAGKQTSLAFIRNPLPQKTLIREDEVFQVMVVGGSIFESALVKKQNSKIIILNHQKISLPIFTTKSGFFYF